MLYNYKNTVDIIIVFFLVIGCCIWIDYSFDKALEKTYHKSFKDREFNILIKVNIPTYLQNDFIQYRKDTYNETWLKSKHNYITRFM